jgi:integrase/recombinase XerD
MPREGKAKVLNEAEFKKVTKIASTYRQAKRNIALLYMSFGLGLRAKEMASLKIKNVIDRNGDLVDEINLLRKMTKGEKKQRHIYLNHPKVRQALQDYLDERKKSPNFKIDQPLFLSQMGCPFSPDSLQQLFHDMFKASGFTGASSHSGRRTFATNLNNKGVDIKTISVLMGHSSVAMTAKYIDDNPVRLKKIAADALF